MRALLSTISIICYCIKTGKVTAGLEEIWCTISIYSLPALDGKMDMNATAAGHRNTVHGYAHYVSVLLYI